MADIANLTKVLKERQSEYQRAKGEFFEPIFDVLKESCKSFDEANAAIRRARRGIAIYGDRIEEYTRFYEDLDAFMKQKSGNLPLTDCRRED